MTVRYVRLFLRKTSTWHRVARLGYHSDISDLSAAVKDLQAHRALPQPVAQKEHVYPSDPRGSSFTFADALEEHITTLEEASSLLSLEELKTIAKEAKIHGKNKAGLLDALRCMSRRQSGLGWVGFKRSHSLPGFPILKSGHGIKEGNSSGDTNMIPSKQVSEQNITDMSIMAGRSNPTSFEDNNRDLHFVLKILANIGPCIRLTLDTLKLFERVHLVYYRSTEWTGMCNPTFNNVAVAYTVQRTH
jgi:Fanconi-associated nuclease 1